MVWNRISNAMKKRRTTIRKINTWLKIAEKYGYAADLPEMV